MSQDERNNYYQNQYEIGLLFERIMGISQQLSTLTNIMRADTGNGGAGPTQAETDLKIEDA